MVCFWSGRTGEILIGFWLCVRCDFKTLLPWSLLSIWQLNGLYLCLWDIVLDKVSQL